VLKFREKYQNVKIEKGEYYNTDPSGIRTGNGPGPEVAKKIEQVAKDLEDYIDKVGWKKVILHILKMRF